MGAATRNNMSITVEHTVQAKNRLCKSIACEICTMPTLFVEATVAISNMVQDIPAIDFSSGQMASSESATPIPGLVAESAVEFRKYSQRNARECSLEGDWEASLDADQLHKLLVYVHVDMRVEWMLSLCDSGLAVDTIFFF